MSDAIQPHDANAVREDIAFMRTLAQQGASGPIFGGSILLATGLIYATASAAVWRVSTHPPSDAAHWLAWIWAAALISQAVITALIILRLRGRGQGMTQTNRSNRMFGVVWNGVGLAIFACMISFALTAQLAHIPAVMAGSPAVVLALYGVGWMATAASSKERWTWGVAALSFLFAIASGALAGNPNLALLFAVAILALLALPGFLLVKRASVRP
jgi:hypothetical protein